MMYYGDFPEPPVLRDEPTDSSQWVDEVKPRHVWPKRILCKRCGKEGVWMRSGHRARHRYPEDASACTFLKMVTEGARQ